ncbi:MAG: winged helix-turn-helix transcriptional regulator, partial [Alphaproteobacteria bacterium]
MNGEDPKVSDKAAASATTNETAITLGLLSAVEQDSSVTQRRLATDLGIALGLANAYLKRCVKKGLIKVGEAPANRYAYYLTPQGFAEKSRLTAEYLSASFQFFRNARAQCLETLEAAAEQGWHRVILYGASELAEVASLHGADGVAIVAVVDDWLSNVPADGTAEKVGRKISAARMRRLSDAMRSLKQAL